MKECMFYKPIEGNILQCHLCHHRCKIPETKRGICGVRENRSGTLYSLVYGKVIAENIDPIEKKPLFHFLPGSQVLSIGTVGCNFRCKHCQNSDISQYPHEHGGLITGIDLTPEAIVAAAKAAACETIAYTYNEPTVFFEFAYDTAILAKKEGIKNVFVSNGYLSAEATRQIAPYLDGINIDLKSFSNDTYISICGARLNPVMETIRLMKRLGVWVEVTTLIIPGINDKEGELRNIARFIKDIAPHVPWHITRFHPAYKLQNLPPTPLAVIRQAREIGIQEKLRHIYTGNIPSGLSENTFCYSCGALLIERYGVNAVQNHLRNGKCPECETSFEGIVQKSHLA